MIRLQVESQESLETVLQHKGWKETDLHLREGLKPFRLQLIPDNPLIVMGTHSSDKEDTLELPKLLKAHLGITQKIKR